MSIEATINVTTVARRFAALFVTVAQGGEPIAAEEVSAGRLLATWTYEAPSHPGARVTIPPASTQGHTLWDIGALGGGTYLLRVEVSFTPRNGQAESTTAETYVTLDVDASGQRVVRAAAEREVAREAAYRIGQHGRGVVEALDVPVRPPPFAPGVGVGEGGPLGRGGSVGAGPLPVQLTRTGRPTTEDEVLWIVIRNSTNSLSFKNYMRFMDLVMCSDPARQAELPATTAGKALRDNSALRLPFPGVEPYRQLKVATEAFLQLYCGVSDTPRFAPRGQDTVFSTALLQLPLQGINRVEEEARFGRPLGDLGPLFDAYAQNNIVLDPTTGNLGAALPYLAIVRAKLPEVAVRQDGSRGFDCLQILQEKLLNPCFLELIWSYWHEEGMLVQTLLKLVDRFQNRRAPGDRDPLANLEIDPLRSLNGFFWGYLQDEQHRLGVRRRAHEYLHHYGISLHGKAVSDVRAADRRSKFLESFHNLLYQCSLFYRQEDDTTIVADGFPVMNALKETHYVLAQGAHNQFGDLPATARQEMLIEQWLLARPEMREFLGGRVMVPYPEVWMDRVDAMKSLQGWSDVSVVHFRDLGVYGEQILLSVRYGAWSTVNDPNQAANWARYWRPEVQAYLHAYRAVTGVDITADVTAPRELAARFLPPSVHLRNRLLDQARR